MLERIINARNNDADIIIDAYCMCGTIVDVTQELRHQWSGIDMTDQFISIALKRLEDAFGSEVLNMIVLDGTAYFWMSHTENERMVVQAKSGHVG